MDHEIAGRYFKLLKLLNEKFAGDGEHDLNSALFIIGVQEVGKGYKLYNKDEKMNLIHVAICTILEPYGFYKFIETDKDGWPHFERLKKVPALSLEEQEELLKTAVVNYFSENRIFDFS
jgi:hypothetical protein